MKVACVVGARPNFMKIAPIVDAMSRADNLDPFLIHTGQHYDEIMSKVFFEDLGMPRPDVYLGIGSDSHTRQTARIMTDFEKLMEEHKPDYVLVVGDVNSTLAASLVASKLRVRLGHVESGLRSHDRDMPEEINRLVTDAISDDLYTSCADAAPNLRKEGVPEEKIFFVGNVMIDSLVKHRERSRESSILEDLGVDSKGYALVTLHRPSNVDVPETFQGILEALGDLSQEKPVLFPIHPRTRKRIQEFGLESKLNQYPNLRLEEPKGYLDFLRLMDNAALVLTDSGGIQEETTFLSVPCLTLRLNTERPVTVDEGTNTLVGVDPEAIRSAGKKALTGDAKKGTIPELWDGKASERIVDILSRFA
ncbi:MAG: UDP-N-acetylglucosamine 2-epimerase (non-hydrolyzing) [Candidatus Eisenbacteria bacterium]|uniref:UDP-N-acetylglucosamine 2-epimerase (Non-hydrolyzing) n=1 Tax=Eiseniibacteriota bacterium TaxID=2212470 RepID=A0A7Y2E9R3_UNCEI|nr:UDP-N-acetylglucosamine 2-epimerase (non-hydrolyzing) [Candidatus Eisenbacteria bacterium]